LRGVRHTLDALFAALAPAIEHLSKAVLLRFRYHIRGTYCRMSLKAKLEISDLNSTARRSSWRMSVLNVALN
jgi:hypothetical protein